MANFFRREVTANLENRLHGEVLLSQSIPHWLIVTFLTFWILLVAIWLVNCSFSRKATVQGWIEPNTGEVRLTASRNGVVTAILVNEGDTVATGQELLKISSESHLGGGQKIEQLILAEFEEQERLIKSEIQQKQKSFPEKLKTLEFQISSAITELSLIKSQLKNLQSRQKISQSQTMRYRQLNGDGYISDIELEFATTRDLELENEQQLLQRTQLLSENKLRELQLTRELLPHDHENDIRSLQSRLSDLNQRMAEVEARHTYTVKSVKSGKVGNIMATRGQTAHAGQPLLTLLSEDDALVVKLLVPVRASGFVERGQEIRIRYQAFAYQKFGVHQGTIKEISDSILLPNEVVDSPVRVTEPVYRATVHLKQQELLAFGRRVSLKPGMTLSADIELAERSLVEWLIEPLLSLRGRIQ